MSADIQPVRWDMQIIQFVSPPICVSHTYTHAHTPRHTSKLSTVKSNPC